VSNAVTHPSPRAPQNFAGFLQNLGVIEGTEAMRKAYWFSLLTTTSASALVYWSLTKFFPQANARKGSWREPREYIAPDDPWWAEHPGQEAGGVGYGAPVDATPDTAESKEKDEGNEASVYVLPAGK
jgi:hypothetical protein